MKQGQQEYYLSIEKEGVAEFKDRGSRFIAYAFPISNREDFKIRYQSLKKEHPKAVHHCFAYRLGADRADFRSSDDGEPSGSAGRPILGQIDSKGLTNCAVVVVRYFGGTLLGVPGLINAYKTSTSLALQMIPLVQKAVVLRITVEFEYPRQNEVLQILRQAKAVIREQDMQLFCRITAEIPLSLYEEAVHKLKDKELNFISAN
jgi:uncharacterized YigZ family protein